MKGLITGGGIAGLTTAIALEKYGINTPVYEAASELKEVGAGIILSINATRVLKHLDLLPEIEDLGKPLNKMVVTDQNLNRLTSNTIPEFTEKYNLPTVAIHRAKLQKALLNKLSSPVYLNKELTGIQETPNQVTVSFSDGATEVSDYVICADGINSEARKIVAPGAKLRDHEQKCWRGVVDYSLKPALQNALIESWGKGIRFGFAQIEDNKVYWYALITNKDYTGDIENVISFLTNLFGQFNPIVKEIIAATDPESIICNEIWDCPPPKKWYTERICLIGDAAHATSPNLGQGAALAMEDALLIAKELATCKENSPECVFKAFQSVRKSKTAYTVNQSKSMGQVAHMRSGLLCSLRNFAMKQTPYFMAKQQMDKLLKPDFTLI